MYLNFYSNASTSRSASNRSMIGRQAGGGEVDETTWTKAIDVLLRNRNKLEATRPYDEATDALLRAGHVYCSHCNHRMAVNRRRGTVAYKCQSVYRGADSECRGWAVEAGKLDAFVWGYVESLFADPGVLTYEVERSRPVIEQTNRDEVTDLRKALASIESEQATLAGHLTRLTGSAAEPIYVKLNALSAKHDALTASCNEALRREALVEQVTEAERSFWDDVIGYAEQIQAWGYSEKQEALDRLGVRVYVQKEGSGRGCFTIEVAPPWPEGTGWELWREAEEMRPTEFEFGPGGVGVTTLSTSVYAAYTRTKSLANEGE